MGIGYGSPRKPKQQVLFASSAPSHLTVANRRHPRRQTCWVHPPEVLQHTASISSLHGICGFYFIVPALFENDKISLHLKDIAHAPPREAWMKDGARAEEIKWGLDGFSPLTAQCAKLQKLCMREMAKDPKEEPNKGRIGGREDGKRNMAKKGTSAALMVMKSL